MIHHSFQSEQGGLQDVGTSDDSELSKMATNHLIDVLPAIFGRQNDVEMVKSELKANWSGIMGFTSDGSPIVGKLPPSVTKRRDPTAKSEQGEWIAAGFNGYGMVNAWLAGRAVAQMAMGDDVSEWLPESYGCSESRLSRMNARDFAEAWFGSETENQQAVET